jgi:hypothetical protein
MAPAQANAHGSSWDSSTTIELVALILTIPGAIAAIATLRIIRRQFNIDMRRMFAHC